MLVCGDLIQSVCLDFDVSPELFFFVSQSSPISDGRSLSTKSQFMSNGRNV